MCSQQNTSLQLKVSVITAGAVVFVSLFTCRLPKIYTAQDRHRSTTSPIQFGSVQGAPQNAIKKHCHHSGAIMVRPFVILQTAYYVRATSEKSKPTWKNWRSPIRALISIPFNWLLACAHRFTFRRARWLRWRCFLFALCNRSYDNYYRKHVKSNCNVNVEQKRIADTNGTACKNPCNRL